jgi:choline dehydrogenase-like flavoprotein
MISTAIFFLLCTWSSDGYSLQKLSSTYSAERSSLRGLSNLYSSSTDTEAIVVGSGLGGLSCAALLAASGVRVTLLESHYEIGGCAHEFLYREDGTAVASDRMKPEDHGNVYRFEAGPSLYSGLSSERSPNPLKHVFQMIGEEPEWITYDQWTGYFPEAADGNLQGIGAGVYNLLCV